ncbi:flagellar assembly protein FliW [Sporolactobacillus sp. THM7-4]|nr:flagellar assembly protein FliW [Sporolactobacillus sp. THM7-4]
MKTETKYYGELEIEDKDILSFPNGLPGFLDERRFILQPFGEAFFILQSVDEPETAFIVTSPFLFFEKYSVDLPDHFVKQLRIRSEEDVSVWVIVSIQRPFPESTVNLRAPIIINRRERIGKQYIPDHSRYGLRHRLMSEKAASKVKEVK